jgi:hypothetical protein
MQWGRVHSRRPLVIGLAGGVIVAGVAGLLLGLRTYNNPTRQARVQTSDFLSALERRDWRALYAQSPEKEFQANGFTLEQFESLMASATKGLAADALKDATLEEIPAPRGVDREGDRQFLVTFPHLRRSGTQAQHLSHAMRDASGWHISVEELPLRLCWHQPGTKEEAWVRVAKAMDTAGVDRYPLQFGHLVLTRQRLQGFLDGKLKIAQIYERVASRR